MVNNVWHLISIPEKLTFLDRIVYGYSSIWKDKNKINGAVWIKIVKRNSYLKNGNSWCQGWDTTLDVVHDSISNRRGIPQSNLQE